MVDREKVFDERRVKKIFRNDRFNNSDVRFCRDNLLTLTIWEVLWIKSSIDDDDVVCFKFTYEELSLTIKVCRAQNSSLIKSKYYFPVQAHDVVSA